MGVTRTFESDAYNVELYSFVCGNGFYIDPESGPIAIVSSARANTELFLKFGDYFRFCIGMCITNDWIRHAIVSYRCIIMDFFPND